MQDKPEQARPYDQRRRLLATQLAAVSMVPLVLLSRPAWVLDGIVVELMELVGTTLLLVCIFGRLWTILYSGSKKNVELVTRGPYSITRNPLYLFSALGGFGIGLLFGSATLSVLIGGISTWIFVRTGRAEARFLQSRFGDDYVAYARRTPFLLPRPSLYREVDAPTFDPVALRRTFKDALYFLAVIPVVELVEHLRRSGAMPDLLELY